MAANKFQIQLILNCLVFRRFDHYCFWLLKSWECQRYWEIMQAVRCSNSLTRAQKWMCVCLKCNKELQLIAILVNYNPVMRGKVKTGQKPPSCKAFNFWGSSLCKDHTSNNHPYFNTQIYMHKFCGFVQSCILIWEVVYTPQHTECLGHGTAWHQGSSSPHMLQWHPGSHRASSCHGPPNRETPRANLYENKQTHQKRRWFFLCYI